MMHTTTTTMGAVSAAILAGSPALGRPFDDHRAGILLRVATLLTGLFHAPLLSRLVISDPNLIGDSGGLWTPAMVSQAIRRAHGDEYGEAVGDEGRRDKRSGLFVPNGATRVIRAGSWTTYSPSLSNKSGMGVKPRGAAFRSGVVQGMLRPALRDHLTAKNAAGNVVRTVIPGGDVAATFIPKDRALGDSVVIITAYRLDPAVTA